MYLDNEQLVVAVAALEGAEGDALPAAPKAAGAGRDVKDGDVLGWHSPQREGGRGAALWVLQVAKKPQHGVPTDK